MAKAELVGKIRLDGNQWRAGLQNAQRAANKWGTAVTQTVQGHLLAAFSMQSVIAMVQRSVDRYRDSLTGAGSLVTQARRADLGSLYGDATDENEKLVRSIETIQELGFALEQFGIEADRASDMFQDISTRRIEALEGFDEGRENDQTRAFRNLGIGEDDLRKLTGPELLFKLGENLKGTAESDKIKEGMDALFSDAGVDFLVLMREGLKENMQRARSEGLVATGESILARDERRKQEQIDQRRAEMDIAKANEKPGGLFSRIFRLYERSLFEVLGDPSNTALGIGVSAIGLGGSGAVNSLQGNRQTQDLEERLEQKRLLKEIALNTKATTDNTEVLNR